MTRGEGIKALSAAVLVSLAIGIAAGWWMTRPNLIIETPAPEIVQADGSKIIERKPDAKAKPKQILPQGTTLERVIHIEAQGSGIRLANGEVKICPRVTVDLSLVRETNGMKRVVASSPDGEIVGAVDIPVETAAPPPEPKRWAAGISIDPVSQTGGIWLERDLARVRVGVEINQARPTINAPIATEIRVRAGWTF